MSFSLKVTLASVLHEKAGELFCLLPQETTEVQTAEELDRVLKTHDWKMMRVQKIGNSMNYYLECERCKVSRNLTMVAIGLEKEYME